MDMIALVTLFTVETTNHKLPPGLLSALCFVESSHKITAVNPDDGKSASLGVCQIKLQTARLMGFRGTEEQLMHPKYNIKYAAKYLGYQMRRYDNDINKAIAAYNAGSFKESKKIKGRAVNNQYVNKVLTSWIKQR